MRNYFAFSDIPFGIVGGTLVSLINFKIFFGHLLISDQVGLPVNNSMVRQPRLHISALKEYPSYLTTSGAIQYGEPFKELQNSPS